MACQCGRSVMSDVQAFLRNHRQPPFGAERWCHRYGSAMQADSVEPLMCGRSPRCPGEVAAAAAVAADS